MNNPSPSQMMNRGGIKVAFLRHAPTQWNKEGRIQGSLDTPILESSISELQEKSVPKNFQNYQIFTSPLKRAIQTAKALGLTDFQQDSRLRECDFGKWEGLTKSDIRDKFPDHFSKDYHGLESRVHGGESLQQVQQRILSWIQNLQVNTLAISHKSLITSVYALATDWQVLSPPKDKLEFKDMIHVFEYRAGELSVERLNIRLNKR